MKKAVFLVMWFSLIFGICYAEENPFAGTWYLNYISQDGENMINAKDMNYSAVLIITENGYTFEDSEGTEGSGEFEMVSDTIITLTINDNKIDFEIKDDCLFTNNNELFMYFYQKESEAFIIPPVLNNAAPEDFEGDWTSIKVSTDGMIVDWNIAISESGQNIKTNIVKINNGILDIFGMDDLYRMHMEDNGVMAFRGDNVLFAVFTPDIIMQLHEENIATLEVAGMIFILQR